MEPENSSFLQLCKLASYGFNVVPGSFVSKLGRIDYEFEPGHGVRISQMIKGKKIERTILFSDLFARK